MQLLREAPSIKYEKWLEVHAGEAVSGVYALFEADDCVFVGMGNDAVTALQEVRATLGADVSLKIEEHDGDGVMSLVFGSWLDEASPGGVRPRVNAERAAARAAARGFRGVCCVWRSGPKVEVVLWEPSCLENRSQSAIYAWCSAGDFYW